ncbi:MAG: MFS transporter [Anaerolineae bacterium]
MWRDSLRSVRRLLTLPTGTDERNISFLYFEIVFAAVLSAAASFNGAYILRLGGSNALIALMSSIPSLLAIFLYIPSARFLEGRQRLKPWMVASLFVSRLGYLMVAALPLLLGRMLPELTVAILVSMTIPSVFFSTAWSPLLSDVVPIGVRANVLAWRSILTGATVAPMIFLAGRWLDTGAFPSNYQWLYLVGFLSGAYGVFLISRIQMPEHKPAERKRDQPKESLLTSLTAGVRRNSSFARIMANTFVFSLGAWMVGPLYIILFVRQLGASDGWVGLNGTLANVGVIVGYWFWRRITRRVGESRTLLIALPLSTIYPFLVALYPNLTFILLAGFLFNFIAPGVDLSHAVIFLGLLPPGKKHSSTALYSTVMNIGAFVAPLIGVALSEVIGILPVLVLGGLIRMVGVVLFYTNPVQPVEAEASPG